MIFKTEKFEREVFLTCGFKDKIFRFKNKVKKSRWIFAAAGFLSLLWFLIRVVPKPDRALYPCQRLAAPYAFGFVAWLASLKGIRLPSL